MEKVFRCDKCDKSFSNKSNFKRHNTRTHKEKTEDVLAKTRCIHPGCERTFFHKTKMVKHLEEEHCLETATSQLHFSSMEDFQEWKRVEETTNFVYFTQQRGPTTGKKTKYLYFICQQDGTDKAHRSKSEPARLTVRKNKKGQIKTGITCPARMLVKIHLVDNSVDVTYIRTHSHEVSLKDTQHHPMPKSIRDEIKGKIAMGIPLSQIRQDLQEVMKLVNKNQAASITDVEVHACESSRYLKPLRMKFKQDGKPRSWDYLKVHDSVATLLFNTDREVFILVRQFRPAVYASASNAYTEGETVDTVEHEPGKCGFTYELCAGIVDKDLSLRETAREEIQEETGYEVPLDNVKPMMSVRNSVGITGSKQHIFYAEVTDAMKSLSGGGNPHEGESIEVIEVPLKEADGFLWDESLEKPPGLVAAFLWYFRERGFSQRSQKS